MQAHRNLAHYGFYLDLLEKSPAMGGTMTQLDSTLSTCECAIRSVSPVLVEVGRLCLTTPPTSAQEKMQERFFQYQPELNPMQGL